MGDELLLKSEQQPLRKSLASTRVRYTGHAPLRSGGRAKEGGRCGSGLLILISRFVKSEMRHGHWLMHFRQEMRVHSTQ